MKTIFGSLVLLLATFSPAWSADSQLPSTVKVTIRMHGDDTRDLQHEFMRGDERMRWTIEDSFTASFVDLHRVSLRRKSRGEKLIFHYQYKGKENPDRRILIDVRALDASGNELLHTWAMDSDARIGPHEVPMGSMIFTRSSWNSTWILIPTDILHQIARYQVELRELSANEAATFPPRPPKVRRKFSANETATFPPRPHKLRLARVRSSCSRRVEFVFDNPQGWEIDANKHKIAFTQYIYSADGALRERRTRFLPCQVSGNYRVVSEIRPDCIAHSHVSIAMYTDQFDGGKFERRFFIDEKGMSYSGMWTGDGGKIAQLPFVDSDYR